MQDKLLSDIYLSKDIAELEDDVSLVWEPPDIYKDVFKDNVWLIYGRKGSGKSHLVNYLEKDMSNIDSVNGVITIRPREDKLFPTVMSAISEVENSDERIVIENVAASLEFVVISLLMRRCLDLKGFLKPNSDHEIIYNFLVKNKFHEGSMLHKAVGVLSKVTGGQFKILDNLASMLAENPLTKGFSDAKDALWRCIKNRSSPFIICIDDIDEIGFSFSRSDRLFVNALMVLMLRLNLELVKNKYPLRILLTSPSELFFHSSLWGDDWVETKSRCLRWTNHESIQRIVNKRIGQQLNIRKRDPRNECDIYSSATQQTWRSLFPMCITNKLERNESALKYILRHTFYTPRQVLDLSDRILNYMGDKGISVESVPDVTDYEWSVAFQTKVEEYSCGIVNSFLKLYSKIYDGLEDVFQAFTSRPAIWSRSNLSAFIDKECLVLTKKEPKKTYSGDALISKLQQLGFLGMGTQDLVSTTMTISFNMRFSFLERLPSSRPWEIAVITPLFYDSYNIVPQDRSVVVPHEKLTLSTLAWKEIAQYKP